MTEGGQKHLQKEEMLPTCIPQEKSASVSFNLSNFINNWLMMNTDTDTDTQMPWTKACNFNKPVACWLV